MTYQKLKEELAKLTPEQLQMDVTVFDSNMDEWFPAHKLLVTGDAHDVLDPHHPFISFSP